MTQPSPSANDWLVPEWPAPAGVHALCTTRNGGDSSGPYASLNLGNHVGDDAGCVASNRAVLQGRLQDARAVFLEQVHGTGMALLDADTPDGTVADIAWTRAPMMACTVMVADCLPVLLTDRQGTQVAAAHAGWRGLLGMQGQGVLEVACAHMAQAGSQPGELMAWLGPCIGPDAFEVGPEVRDAFLQSCAEDARWFVPTESGKWRANLPALAQRRLRSLGVEALYGNDGSQAWCTVSNPSWFFSHRRDRISGRLAACIWRDD